MKAKELREKSVEELVRLLSDTQVSFFEARLQNFTNQLDDTSLLSKRRKTAARIRGELRRRELAAFAHALTNGNQ